MVAQALPPPSLPAKRLFFLVMACGLNRPFDDVGVDLDAPVGEEALQRRSAADAVPDRLRQLRLAGQTGQLALPRGEEVVYDRDGVFRARRATVVGILSANLVFDLPERSHRLDRLRGEGGTAIGMKLEELAAQMAPAAGEHDAIIGPLALGEPIVGGVAVHLQNAAVACQMPRDTFAAAAVFELVRHHRRSTAAKRRVIPGVSPQPCGFHLARSRRQRRQRRLVGEDPLALFDAVENGVGQRREFEADAAHPLRHQRAVQLHLVARVDGLLAIERQPVGVLGDGDLGEQCLGRNAGLDQMIRRRRLDDAVTPAIGIFRPARHDHPELGRRHVEALADVLADLDLLQPVAAGRCLRLDHHLHPLKMGGEALARARRPGALGLVLPLVQFRLDLAEARLDLVEDERLLLLIQPIDLQLLGASSVARPLQHLDDRRQLRNALVGPRIAHLEVLDLGIANGGLLRHGEDHRLERIHIIGKIGGGQSHGPPKHIRPSFACSSTGNDSICRSRANPPTAVASPTRDGPSSSPAHPPAPATAPD